MRIDNEETTRELLHRYGFGENIKTSRRISGRAMLLITPIVYYWAYTIGDTVIPLLFISMMVLDSFLPISSYLLRTLNRSKCDTLAILIGVSDIFMEIIFISLIAIVYRHITVDYLLERNVVIAIFLGLFSVVTMIKRCIDISCLYEDDDLAKTNLIKTTTSFTTKYSLSGAIPFSILVISLRELADIDVLQSIYFIVMYTVLALLIDTISTNKVVKVNCER